MKKKLKRKPSERQRIASRMKELGYPLQNRKNNFLFGKRNKLT